MSDMTDRTITDAKGRKLLVRELDVLEEIDLFEIAGPDNSVNPAWLGTALMVCSIRAVDGNVRPFPRNMEQYRAAVIVMGNGGRDALRLDRAERDKAERIAAEAAARAASGGAPAPDDLAKN